MRILQALCLYLVFALICTLSQDALHSLPLRPIHLPQNLKLQAQTNAVKELCSTYANRSQLVDSYDLEIAKDYRNSINSFLKINGLAVLKLLANSQTSAAWDQIQKNLVDGIFFLSSFAVGLVLLLLSWPFLLCCCFCNCCKSKSKAAENTLLILFMLGLVLAVGTSIYGLIQTLDIGDSIQKTGCAAAIIPNDLLYGNTTNDGKSFFSGFYQISLSIVLLQPNLQNIGRELLRLAPGNPIMDNALQLLRISKSDTVKLSNNDAGGSNLVLDYASPINDSLPAGKVSSTFPQILGSVSAKSGITWAIYQALDSLDSTLQNLRTSAVEYNNEIANFYSGIFQIESQTLNIIQNIEDSENSIEQHLSQFQNAITYSNLGVKVYYGVVIAFSAVGMLAAFLGTKFNSCRFMVPVACVVLFFAALTGFFLSVVFTIALPPLTWSCSYMEDSLTNENNFRSNFDFLVDSQTLKDISVCMPFGNGDIVSKIGIDAAAGLNNLTEVIKTLNSFQIEQYKQPIQSNLQNCLSVIAEFAQSRIIDISDASTIALLTKISNPNLYSYQNCSQRLSNDSWVPSNSPDPNYPSIACRSATAKAGDQTSCPRGVADGDPCSGCMDTGSLSNYYYKNGGSIFLQDLNSRYTSSCSFNNELNNIWTNYYLVKARALGPDVQGNRSTAGVLPRARTVGADVDLLVNSIDPALPNVFNTILADLGYISDLLDPSYGLIAGLNCKLMGQDFQRLEQATCGSIYTKIYITRLVLGIASYGLLLAICLAVPLSKKQVRRERIAISDEITMEQPRVLLNEPLYGNKEYAYSENEGRYDRLGRANEGVPQNTPIYFILKNPPNRQ